jgi:MFS transporter, DHA1 family, solute carrier family 18 (vesicular amine transporter), member 1/2
MTLIALALFVVSLGYGVIIPQMPAFFPEDVAPVALTAVYVGYAVAKYALQIPGGILADRFGDARVIRLGLIVFTLSLLGLAVPAPPVIVIVARALEGAATGLLYPALLLRAARSGSEGRGRRLGVVAGIGTSGFVVGPGLAALLAPEFGARAPVWVAFGLALVITASSIGLKVSQGASSAPITRGLVAELKALVAPLGSAAFVFLMLPVLQNKLVYTGMQAVLPQFLPSLGVDARGVALVFVLTGVGFAVGQPLGGLLGDRVRPRGALFAVVPLCAVALAAVASAGDAASFLAAYLVWVLCGSMAFALSLKALADEHGESAGAGGVFGVYQTLTDAATIVGPPLFLGALEWSGGFAAFSSMAAAAAGAVFLMAVLASRRPS